MKKQIFVAVLISLLIVGAFGLTKFFQIRKAIAAGSSFRPPPVAVTSIDVSSSIWEDTLEVVGTLASTQGITVSSETSGKVTQIAFVSGANVNKGDLLVEVDASVEEGLWKAAGARLDRTQKTLGRLQALRDSHAISAEQFDTAQAEYRAASAESQSLRAALEKKKIYAPFTGQLGIRVVNLGQYVSEGTALVPLQSMDPLYLNFSLPQQDLGKIQKGLPVELFVDSYPGIKFLGNITTINPEVDESTRTLALQVTLPNSSGQLRPGMFGSVKIILPNKLHVLAIPQSAISFAPYGDMVYVIEKAKKEDGSEDLTVRQQIVKLGKKVGDLVAIDSGLKEGQQVVSTGLFKLRPGAAVVINNTVQPGASTDPKPKDT